ncbi:MAG: acylphosphatase [Candidatus Heimdallarchaeota archaeon]|nr:acylphosphatase [Candidatus Heimdallarchaeota archaeon]
MTEEKTKRIEIIVTGQVQGVFFRASIRDFALKLNLEGTVRNRRDGSVEIIAEGTEEKLNELIGFAKIGPPSAKVYNIDVTWKEPERKLSRFRVIY